MASSTLIRDFARHARNLPALEPDIIDTLVEFKDSYFDDPNPARWQVDVLRELLLDILPRKVTAPDDWFAAVIPTATAYLTFLRDGQSLAPGSDPADVLLAEVDRIGDGVLAASRDPRNFGMAKAIFSSVGGLDLSAPDPAAAAMEAFNSLPDAERARILDPSLRGGPGLPPWLVPHSRGDDSWGDDFSGDDSWGDDFSDDDREWPDLPLTWLPPDTELAAAARSAPLVAALARLITWNGTRHEVTRQEVLPLPDARQACADLGLPLPADAVDAADTVDAADAADAADAVDAADGIPALQRLWSLALDTELLEIERSHAVPGPAAAQLTDPSGDPAAMVAWWAELLDSCLTGLPPHAEDDDVPVEYAEDDDLAEDIEDIEDAVDAVVRFTLSELYAGTRVPLDGLQEVVLTTIEQECAKLAWRAGLPQDDVVRAAGRRWSRHLTQLGDLGAVTVADNWINLTPLGRAGVRALAVQDGADAPLADDPAALDVATLVQAYPQLGDLVTEPLCAAWAAARGPERAIAELLDAARTGTATTRVSVVTILDESLGDHVRGAGRPAVEAMRDDPVLGMCAHTLLAEPGKPADLSPRLRQWAVLETVAIALEVGVLDSRDATSELWRTVEAEGDLDTAWRSSHPQLDEILEAIAKHHPKGRVRKAAKKAIYKAQRAAAQN